MYVYSVLGKAYELISALCAYLNIMKIVFYITKIKPKIK